MFKMALSTLNTVKLNTGLTMPIIGVGSFKICGQDILQVLDIAFKVGYRAIDSATVYRNEADIKDALHTLLPKYKLTRNDIFITSKLAPADQGAGRCREAVLRSLSNLGIDFIDLYLIHWPGSQGFRANNPDNPKRRMESWKDLENLYQEGLVKNIGVSNYTIHHMEELLSQCKVKPAVLQSECHPHLVQKDVRDFCREHSIHFQAYSSLGSPAGKNELLSEEAVQTTAATHQRSPAQVLLRWAVQQHIGVLPKSTNPAHIEDNMNIFDFELSDSEMVTLSGLHKDTHYCWDPNTIR